MTVYVCSRCRAVIPTSFPPPLGLCSPCLRLVVWVGDPYEPPWEYEDAEG